VLLLTRASARARAHARTLLIHRQSERALQVARAACVKISAVRLALQRVLRTLRDLIELSTSHAETYAVLPPAFCYSSLLSSHMLFGRCVSEQPCSADTTWGHQL